MRPISTSGIPNDRGDGGSSSFTDVVVVTKPAGTDVTGALDASGYQVAAITARHLVYVRGEASASSAPAIAAVPALASDTPVRDRSGRRGALSVTEAAKVLGVSRSYAYDLVHTGALPHLRLGRRIVIPEAALDRLLNEPAKTA